MKPTREGLEVLGRLTGIDMSGIIAGPADSEFSRWLAEECIRAEDATLTARAAYQSFCEWWSINYSEKQPTQKRFGDAMSRMGIKKDRGGPGGSMRYVGIARKPQEGLSDHRQS